MQNNSPCLRSFPPPCFLAHHIFLCNACGSDYYPRVCTRQKWQCRELLFPCCVECFKCSKAESESSVDRSAEVKQTMQSWLLQCGSRLCRHCVLEPHNALAWAGKWHIPKHRLSSQSRASVSLNSSPSWINHFEWLNDENSVTTVAVRRHLLYSTDQSLP